MRTFICTAAASPMIPFMSYTCIAHYSTTIQSTQKRSLLWARFINSLISKFSETPPTLSDTRRAESGNHELGGRKGRPAGPGRHHAGKEGKKGKEAVGEGVRQAHEARAPDDREDARRGEELPRDSRRAGARSVDRGERGREAPVRHGAARSPGSPRPPTSPARARACRPGLGAATGAGRRGYAPAR